MTILGMTNSRMKDFFDLWVLLNDATLDDEELQRAVKATFARRQTALPDMLPLEMNDAFAEDAANQLQWRAFLGMNQLESITATPHQTVLRD